MKEVSLSVPLKKTILTSKDREQIDRMLFQ